MNYLAHAYLSFHHQELLVGNMISDFVKGKKKLDYPHGIQNGILLHRAIDTFTDEHPATQKAKEVFRPHYRLYSGAFVDIVFDHFLAADETHFTDDKLQQFAEDTYQTLHAYTSYFPEGFARMFPYMWQQNWLYHYRSRWGTEKSFGGLVRRAAYLTESEPANRLLNEQYSLLRACYHEFFPSVYDFAHSLAMSLIDEKQ